MKNNPSSQHIAHILPHGAMFLTIPITERILQGSSSPVTIFVRTNKTKKEDIIKYQTTFGNRASVIPLFPSLFSVVFHVLCFRNARIKNGVDYFIPRFSIISLFRLLRGPKKIVIHSNALTLPTLLFLRLAGKQLIYISWGGNQGASRVGRFALMPFLSLYKKIFVLMEPEEKYFSKWISPKKIKTLPYPSIHKGIQPWPYEAFSEIQKRSIILGNSRDSIPQYEKLLEKIPKGAWTRIFCMLNYGKNSSSVETFINKQKRKYGENVFIPWLKVVSREQYIKDMSQAAFYICPVPYQRGLGAISFSIVQNKILLLTGDNYRWIKKFNVNLHHIDSFPEISYDKLKSFIPTKEIAEHYSKNYLSAVKELYKTPVEWNKIIVSSFE